MSRHAIVIPLKRFTIAKMRLRASADVDASSIAMSLADNVITHSRPRHVIVLSESPDVTAFAKERGVEVLVSRATSLNQAVQNAYGELRSRFSGLIIVHGDVRCPENLGNFTFEPGITFVADHHGQGTNVMAIPTGLDFLFSYGQGSLERHVNQAQRLGVDFRVIVDSPWRFDVDTPRDLNHE